MFPGLPSQMEVFKLNADWHRYDDDDNDDDDFWWRWWRWRWWLLMTMMTMTMMTFDDDVDDYYNNDNDRKYDYNGDYDEETLQYISPPRNDEINLDDQSWWSTLMINLFQIFQIKDESPSFSGYSPQPAVTQVPFSNFKNIDLQNQGEVKMKVNFLENPGGKVGDGFVRLMFFQTSRVEQKPVECHACLCSLLLCLNHSKSV